MAQWALTPDGEPFDTFSSTIVEVRRRDEPLVLKVARHEEEARGNRLLAWWRNDGAAPVLATDGDAILMPRADASLVDLALAGDDDRATDVLCRVVTSLHTPQAGPPPAGLMPLERWFRDLEAAAERDGGIFAESWKVARQLLVNQTETLALHGDIHHGNVLDFGTLGWRAIDPKGLFGDRAFDYANLFCNPTADLAEERFEARIARVAENAGLDRHRLAAWVAAWGGLSAAWFRGDGQDASLPLAIARKALAVL